jgi:hypothetical protein
MVHSTPGLRTSSGYFAKFFLSRGFLIAKSEPEFSKQLLPYVPTAAEPMSPSNTSMAEL